MHFLLPEINFSHEQPRVFIILNVKWNNVMQLNLFQSANRIKSSVPLLYHSTLLRLFNGCICKLSVMITRSIEERLPRILQILNRNISHGTRTQVGLIGLFSRIIAFKWLRSKSRNYSTNISFSNWLICSFRKRINSINIYLWRYFILFLHEPK